MNDALVLGPGSGSEILGALRAGCNVVAIEKDLFQFNLTKERVIKAHEYHISEVNRIRAADPQWVPDHFILPLPHTSFVPSDVHHAMEAVPRFPTHEEWVEFQKENMVLVEDDEEPETRDRMYACYCCLSKFNNRKLLLRCMFCTYKQCERCWGEGRLAAHVCVSCKTTGDPNRITAIEAGEDRFGVGQRR